MILLVLKKGFINYLFIYFFVVIIPNYFGPKCFCLFFRCYTNASL